MIFYLYKITNIIDNRFYIGTRVYRGGNPNRDKYFGSGTRLRRAIQKYGKQNFQKEILCFFTNRQQMYLTQNMMVDKQFIKRKDTYNIAVGGLRPVQAGQNHYNRGRVSPRKGLVGVYKRTQQSRRKQSITISGVGNHMYGKTHTEQARRKISEVGKINQNKPEVKQKNRQAHLGKITSEYTKKILSQLNSGQNNWNYGKKLSQQTKQKIRIACTGVKQSEQTRKKKSEKSKLMWQKRRQLKTGEIYNNEKVV